jgi:hypothetical protein
MFVLKMAKTWKKLNKVHGILSERYLNVLYILVQVLPTF